jgi:hypothetical protein
MLRECPFADEDAAYEGNGQNQAEEQVVGR